MCDHSHICVHTHGKPVHFDQDDKGVYYTTNTQDKVYIHPESSVEFDVDIDHRGLMGMVVLDKKGNLYYYHENESTWENHLLYTIHSDQEIFSHIHLKFSIDTPYIVFCWRNHSSPLLCSIVSYYIEKGSWRKKVFDRIYLKEDIEPYIFIRDSVYSLYMVHLRNDNMIYNIVLSKLPYKSKTWTQAIDLCSCLYVKSFHMDGLIDLNQNLHLTFTDRYKKEYCMQYLYVKDMDHESYEPHRIFNSQEPFIHQHMLVQEDSICIYGILKSKILAVLSHFNHTFSSFVLPTNKGSLSCVRMIEGNDKPFYKYFSNYLWCEDPSKPTPLSLDTFTPMNSHKNTAFDKDSSKSNIHETSNKNVEIESIKKIKMQLFKQSQELKTKTDLLNSLQSNLTFLTREMDQLRSENQQCNSIIQKHTQKSLELQKQVESFETHFQKTSSHIHQLEKDNHTLIDDLEDYKNKVQNYKNEIQNYKNECTKYKDQLTSEKEHLKKSYTQIHTLSEENTLLKEELDTLKNRTFIQKLFHS